MKADANRLAEKLSAKIEQELGIQCNPETFRRTYAGRHQKAAGAWVWLMSEKDGIHDVGSCWPASECVKKKYSLSLGKYGEIFPENIRNVNEKTESTSEDFTPQEWCRSSAQPF